MEQTTELPQRLVDLEGFRGAFARQRRVILALMLRFMRTRFFGHGLGYLLAVAWPLTHILMVVAFFSIAGRVPPIGDSFSLFVATGSAPFLIFSYLSRFVIITVSGAKPLLAFPEVKLLDMVFASAILETLCSFVVVIALLFIGVTLDVPVMPKDVVEAAYAIGAAILLGFGFGILNTIVALAMPMWGMFYTLLTVALYMASGVLFVPEMIPEPYQSYLGYNPLIHIIAWMRAAYYEGYGVHTLDRAYALEWGIGSIFVGLLIERAVRGHLLKS